MNNYKIYLLIIFLIILVFTINLILKKINIKSYLKYLLISFFISYFFVLFNPRTKFLFNMTYLKAIILFISLFFFLFSLGLVKAKELPLIGKVIYLDPGHVGLILELFMEIFMRQI